MGFGHSQLSPTTTYIGRFAPSPTGPLHFGSLLAALASYLDARSHEGRWLVRMEDIDPPREVPGAADTILRQLVGHGLLWDGEVLYQSRRSDVYEAALCRLQSQEMLYRCDCSRQRIRAMGGFYNRRCLDRQRPPKQNFSLRVVVEQPHAQIVFSDLFQGLRRENLCETAGDFIVKRRDQLYAYQLAVCIDDDSQRISHVIRGADLLDSTARQIYLLKLLECPIPQYGHIPVATRNGQKLSKQNLAQPVRPETAVDNLISALNWLGLSTTEGTGEGTVEEILGWATARWNRDRIPWVKELPAP